MIYMLKSIRNKKRYLCVQNFHLLNLNLQAYNMSLEVLKEASIDGGVSQYLSEGLSGYVSSYHQRR